MPAGLKVTRLDHTALELRSHAAKCRDAGQVRRLLALTMILEGVSRGSAAAQNGMDRQTLRDWVIRYNALGIAGLLSRHGGGRKAVLSEAQMAELLALVIKGPDPERDRVVRWRCVDLRDEVERRFDVRVHENSRRGDYNHEPACLAFARESSKEARRAFIERPTRIQSLLNAQYGWRCHGIARQDVGIWVRPQPRPLRHRHAPVGGLDDVVVWACLQGHEQPLKRRPRRQPRVQVK